ncbi:unnamed protein product [Paramecium sonneborni]|uniref:Uncharacterized protein n=1 Tax=Paramecium sonneborni TaxID=65129 RepID=A0A8S1Q8L8_9CILI|nr:unnamed protein product [Paramecium sonneborni]
MSINNRGLSKEFQERIINDLGIVECEDFHDGTCLYASFIRLLQLIPKSYKYYIPIHLIPFLIFKRKRVMQRPVKTISVAVYNYGKSVLFVSLYVAICKYALCKLKNIRQKVDGLNPALAASVACSALFLESEGRRQEIALFIFPKSLETAWRLLKKRGYVSSIKGWELFLFGLAMGIINYFYHYDDAAIKSTYLTIFKNFWGKD